MAKSGGKGRISNELVAASFTAVLAVYAAGYWRTREEARRIDARAQERPPVRTASPAVAPAAVVQPPAALPPPQAEVPHVAAAAPQPPAAEAAPPMAPVKSTIAEPAPASTPLPDSPPAPGGNWRDGTYTGWGTSRHGDIRAQVVIRDGRIVDASIASCETRYPCDVIGDIIPQPVARQSPDVDRVSRATESADAYYYGLVEALEEAQIPPDGQAVAPP